MNTKSIPAPVSEEAACGQFSPLDSGAAFWRNIDGWPYSISSFGETKNLRTGYVLKGRPTRCGYLIVTLQNEGLILAATVHTLVARAFLSNPENKQTVNHKNGDKSDNRLSNLEWATHSENAVHAFKLGLRKGRKGLKHHNTILSEDDVRLIRRLGKSGLQQKQIAELFPVCRGTIQAIISRRNWSHID